jgi:SAM-dependent methyltransferase
MARSDLYETYPHDTRYMQEYIAYQQRYVANIRESDRVILEMVAAVLRDRRGAAPAEVLDIGCSTGNLLRHLKQAFPSLALTGGDLSDLQLDACRKDPELDGIAFVRLDIKALPTDRQYDAVLANAILYGFDQDSFAQSLRSICRALRPGGVLIAFDFFHPWKQEIAIVEKTRAFPQGHPLHFRSYSTTEAALREAGFGDVEFNPFAIPIDLPQLDYAIEDIKTHTVETKAGERLQFRGAICQPWCHLQAGKPGTPR